MTSLNFKVHAGPEAKELEETLRAAEAHGRGKDGGDDSSPAAR